GWIAANRAAFGLTAGDVQALAVSRDYTNPASGSHVITFTQVFGGLPAAVASTAAPHAAYQASVTGTSGIWTRFAPGPFGMPQYARAAAFPTAQGVRPAYEVIFTDSGSNMTDAAVDAVTGQILYDQSLTAT